MDKNFKKLMTDTKPQTQEARRTPRRKIRVCLPSMSSAEEKSRLTLFKWKKNEGRENLK